MKQGDFKVGDRVRLVQDMCRQLGVRKLYGVIRKVINDEPPIEVEWEDKDVTDIVWMYSCELKRQDK